MALKRRVNSRWVLIDEGIGGGTYDTFLQISKMIEIFTLMFMNGDVFLWVVVINDRDSLKTTSSYMASGSCHLVNAQQCFGKSQIYAAARSHIKTSR